VISTALSDITRLLQNKGFIKSFSPGDSEGLADNIVSLAGVEDEGRAMAGKALEFLRNEYANDILLKPLVAWAQNPTRAPDLEKGKEAENPLRQAVRDMVQGGKLLSTLKEERKEIEEKLKRVEGSRLYQFLNKFKKF
jgi:hypothetical protein